MLYLEELNETIAGYVVQVAESLLKFNPGTFCSFVYQNSLGERMLWHLHNSSVAELLLQFLVSEAEVKERSKILNLLVKQLRNSKDFIAKNASFILCEIIHQIGNISSWEILISEFMQSVDFVFECFFEESNTEALEVLKALLTSPSRGDIFKSERVSQVFVQKLLEALSLFKQELLKPGNSLEQPTGTIEALGKAKLQIVEIISHSLQLGIPELSTQISKLGFFDLLADLLERFKLNSFLHNVVLSCVVGLFSQEANTLKLEFCSSKFFRNLIHETPQSTLRGHFLKISNAIIKESQTNPQVKQAIQTQEWEAFQTQFVEPNNQLEERHLGGSPPKDFGMNSLNETKLSSHSNYTQETQKTEEELPEDFKHSFDSTTPKIIQNSLFARQRLLGFDSDLQKRTVDDFKHVNYWKLPIDLGHLESLE